MKNKKEKILLFEEGDVTIYYDKSQNVLIRDKKQDDGVVIRSFNRGNESKYSYVYRFSEMLFSRKITEYAILILVKSGDEQYRTYIIHTETLEMLKGVRFTVKDKKEIHFSCFSSGKYKNGRFEGKYLDHKVMVDKKGFTRII